MAAVLEPRRPPRKVRGSGSLATRLRRLAGNAVGWFFETLGGSPPGLVPGAGSRYDGRPVVVVLLFGATAEVVGRTAEALAAGLASGGPRPVLVIDTPHFAAARRAGVVTDHVLSRESFTARGYETSWDDHLAAEIARLQHDLRTRHVVTLPGTGTTELDGTALTDLLTPPGRPAQFPIRLWHRTTRTLERRVDRVR
jgi:hypothetical protein